MQTAQYRHRYQPPPTHLLNLLLQQVLGRPARRRRWRWLLRLLRIEEALHQAGGGLGGRLADELRLQAEGRGSGGGWRG